MITRSAKRKSMHLECNSLLFQVPDNGMQIQSQSSFSVESSSYVSPDNEQFERSVCSIHIHSPAPEIRTIKLSMPGIQPLTQVHLNKVLKTLELTFGNGNKKLTPILGDMELPSESNSARINYLELKSNTSPEMCPTDDVGEETNEVKNDTAKNHKQGCATKKSNSDESSKDNNNKTFKSSMKISSNTFDLNSIMLNKPVVVLRDICKTKYYKTASTAYRAKGPIKKETKEDSSPQKFTDNFCTNTIDTFDTGQSLESVNSSPLKGSKLLTQLAEGCSFSEILNRFRIKNENCLVDTLKCTDTTKHENINAKCFEDYDNQVLKSETCSIHEDKYPVEGFLTSDITEKIESVDFEESNLLDLPQGSECEESKEDTKHLRNQSLDSQMESDHNENTSALQSTSGFVSSDEETVDSPFLTSNVVPDRGNANTSEEICNIYETRKNNLSNVSNSDLKLHESEEQNLETDKEGMKSKKLSGIEKKNKGNKNKRPKSPGAKPRSSPLPKKMKRSNQESGTPHKKVKSSDEFIPLQASGPTKFGVAMLNKIQPYAQHDAKDFKNKMLFGDRNRRHSSSKHLRIYKLKQKVNRSIRG